MLGKVSFNLPWVWAGYSPFSNEDGNDCETVSNAEAEGTLAVVTETQSSDNEGTSVYYLPPPASASVCLPPNPDPPPFNAFAEPLIIETRGLSPSNNPQEKKVDPFYAESLNLQREILNPGGVEIYVSASNLLENVAIVELENNLWVGGWNPRVSNLHSLFHLGDLLVSINDHNVHTQRQFKKIVESTKRWMAQERQWKPGIALNPTEVKCRLRLRRLPLAKTLIVCRQRQDQKIGISFDEDGTNKVKSIDPEGPLACTGLLPFASAFFKKSASVPFPMSALRFLGQKQTTSTPADFVPWTATEINHRPLNPFFKQHEADLLIGARGMVISVTFQPSDFMEALRRKLRKLKPQQTFF
ncbi:unnamed protein product [Taenia asiatica]|uniref:PDZ domain-containing protein n=1 Tax=Taenia asiatica TaxID=60517 RepID=A0A0R3W232_TAEAS|nr:unnamed protein product [Taenia asiatica]